MYDEDGINLHTTMEEWFSNSSGDLRVILSPQQTIELAEELNEIIRNSGVHLHSHYVMIEFLKSFKIKMSDYYNINKGE